MRTDQNTGKTPVSALPLACAMALCILAASWVVAIHTPDVVEGVRRVIRLTARSSLLLFVLAFTASSLAELAPSRATGWLRRNRRAFGLGFAFSHGVHAVGIIALAHVAPAVFDALTTPVSFIAGGLGYALIIALAATSSQRAVACLGEHRWSMLHTRGVWFLAVFFVINFGRRAVHRPEAYWPYMALILAAIALRLIAKRRRARMAPR